MNMNDIEKRWRERVIPNGWDKMGAAGAKLYLSQYGNNIGEQKIRMFATYAYRVGCPDFAEGMIRSLTRTGISEVPIGVAEKQMFNDDALDTYEQKKDKNAKLIEATFKALVDANVGLKGNPKAFNKIIAKCPNVRIRGCLMQNYIVFPDIELNNREQGKEIEELSNGALVFGDFIKKSKSGWAYFTTEE